jgi:hypothetical protein
MGDKTKELIENMILVGLDEMPIYRVSKGLTKDTGSVEWTISPPYNGIARRADEWFAGSRDELMKILSSTDTDFPPRDREFQTDAWITINTWTDRQLAVTMFARVLYKKFVESKARYVELGKKCNQGLQILAHTTEDDLLVSLYNDRMYDRAYKEALDQSDHCYMLYAYVWKLYHEKAPEKNAGAIIHDVLHLNNNPAEPKHGFGRYNMCIPNLGSDEEVLRAMWIADPHVSLEPKFKKPVVGVPEITPELIARFPSYQGVILDEDGMD